jgi:ABC-2 type transport system ATP-binding protein
MSIIDVSHISKSFGPVKAVDDVSFSVEKGEIFGLLGPNGAGKTTTIRIILDIFKPDSGQVSVLGGPADEARKDRIGYMPEERGLYQDIPLERCLVYLASLKGIPPVEARRRALEYMERFDLAEHRHKKVKELSKGMQQKAQIIATLVHRPELVVIDEPFSGLDPVNTQMVKGLLSELHRQGVTVIMSTHQMHQVEELCERIVLIHQGRVVLYGGLGTIRQRFAGHAVLVKPLAAPAGINLVEPDMAASSPAATRHNSTPGSFESVFHLVPGVEGVETHNGEYRLNLSVGASPQEVLRALMNQDLPLERFEIAIPTLDEIFIRVVSGNALSGNA